MEFAGFCLITHDVPRLAQFYCALFETTCAGDDAHMTLTVGGLGLAIWREGALSEAEMESLRGWRKHCSALMFSTTDVDGMYQTALAAGAAVQEPPADQPWGVRAFVVNDPDGNRVDIFGKS